MASNVKTTTRIVRRPKDMKDFVSPQALAKMFVAIAQALEEGDPDSKMKAHVKITSFEGEQADRG